MYFDADAVLKDLNAQVKITTALRQETAGAINSYTQSRQAELREKLEGASFDEKNKIFDEIYKLQYQKLFLESLVNVLSGMPDPVITKDTLQIAATKLRRISLDNSRQSPGMNYVDAEGNQRVSDNTSASSGSFDGVKVGGTRLSTDVICGEDSKRCARDAKNNLITDPNGNYTLKGDEKHPTYASLRADVAEFRAQIGANGGAQMKVGTLFGRPYVAGSLQIE